MDFNQLVAEVSMTQNNTSRVVNKMLDIIKSQADRIIELEKQIPKPETTEVKA